MMDYSFFLSIPDEQVIPVDCNFTASKAIGNTYETTFVPRFQLCYECGEIISSGLEFQRHTLIHEGVSIVQQLYYFEKAEQRERELRAKRNEKKLVKKTFESWKKSKPLEALAMEECLQSKMYVSIDTSEWNRLIRSLIGHKSNSHVNSVGGSNEREKMAGRICAPETQPRRLLLAARKLPSRRRPSIATVMEEICAVSALNNVLAKIRDETPEPVLIRPEKPPLVHKKALELESLKPEPESKDLPLAKSRSRRQSAIVTPKTPSKKKLSSRTPRIIIGKSISERRHPRAAKKTKICYK